MDQVKVWVDRFDTDLDRTGGLFAQVDGRTEGYNSIVKHVGRIAFGIRNTANP